MKKIIVSLLAGLMLVGCQPKEEQQTQGAGPTPEQRKAISQKLTEQAVVLIGRQDYQGAISSLDGAIKFYPENQDPYLILGQILLKSGENARAIEFLENAAKNFPDNGMIFYMLGVANRMDSRKLPAVLAARRSFEIFKNANDKENAEGAALLLQEALKLPDGPEAK